MPESVEAPVKETTSLKSKIESFASKCDISPEQLKNVYHFEPDRPIVIIPLKGSESDNQINASRFLLAAYEEVYGIEWVSLRQDLSEAWN